MLYVTGFEKNLVDIINFSVMMIALFLLYKNKIINLKYFIFFSGYVSLSLIVNNFLIRPFDMWDQITYSKFSIDFRNSTSYFFQLISDNIGTGKISAYSAGILFSIFPIPFLNSVNSLSLINKFIVISSLLFLCKKKKIDNYYCFLILIYPSTIFYSSTGLKEILILTMTLLFIYFYDLKKIKSCIFFFIIILLLRFEYAIIMLLFILIISNSSLIKKLLKFIKVSTKNINPEITLGIFIALLFFLNLFNDFFINFLNKASLTYYQESVGWGSYVDKSKFENDNILKFILNSTVSIIQKFTLNGFPLEKRIFFYSEIFISLYFIYIFISSNFRDKFTKYLILIFLFLITFFIFGIIANYYTMHRYYYNFYILVLLMSVYKFQKQKKYKYENFTSYLKFR